MTSAHRIPLIDLDPEELNREIESASGQWPSSAAMTVSNTAPMAALGTLGLLSVLRDLFDSVKVTETVFREITRFSEKPVSDLFTKHSWTEIVPDPPMPDSWLAAILDPGEATTIALALKENPKRLPINK